MAGLQEQVRQLEDVNEDMLEETARWDCYSFLREAVADEVCRIVDMLSRITEPNALEDVSLNGASPPPLPMEEVVEG